MGVLLKKMLRWQLDLPDLIVIYKQPRSESCGYSLGTHERKYFTSLKLRGYPPAGHAEIFNRTLARSFRT